MIELIDSGHIITKQKLMNSKSSCENASDLRFYTPVISHGVQTTLVVLFLKINNYSLDRMHRMP